MTDRLLIEMSDWAAQPFEKVYARGGGQADMMDHCAGSQPSMR